MIEKLLIMIPKAGTIVWEFRGSPIREEYKHLLESHTKEEAVYIQSLADAIEAMIKPKV